MLRPRLLGLLLALATVLIYLPATRNGFVNYDDDDYITNNPVVQNGLTLAGAKWAFGFHASNWFPLTWLSHMADCSVFRLNAGGHHLVSALIHAANAVLLLLLLFRLTGFLLPALFVAALFAWHPLHVESVAWAAERKDVLSTFFALLTLLAYVRFAQAPTAGCRQSTISPAGRDCALLSPATAFYTLSLACFGLGLLAKPMLVTLPFVMLLLDFWPLRRTRPLWTLLLEKLPFLLLSAAACIVTVLAQKGEAMVPLHLVSPQLRLENSVTAYVGYLQKTIWPTSLSVFYPLPRHVAFSAFLVAVITLLALSAGAWCERRRRPYLLVGWLWYLGTLVPVIGLVQVGNQAMADRYTYFPLVGIFLAATFAIRDFAAARHLSPRWLGLIACAVLAVCLLLTEKQLSYWRDSQTLFTHALAVTGDNALAHLNLGGALEDQGRVADALVEYQETIRLEPGQQMAYSNIGRILAGEGQLEPALEYCRAALSLKPQSPFLHDSVGIVLAQQGHGDEALQEFDTALRLNPDYAPAHYQKGCLLLKQGLDLAAVTELNRAIHLAPDNFAMLIHAARVLAAAENPLARNGDNALVYADQAAALAGAASPLVLDTLAMAEAETGQFASALKHQQQAIDLARNQGLTEDAAAMQARLGLYQKHQPWRESFHQP